MNPVSGTNFGSSQAQTLEGTPQTTDVIPSPIAPLHQAESSNVSIGITGETGSLSLMGRIGRRIYHWFKINRLISEAVDVAIHKIDASLEAPDFDESKVDVILDDYQKLSKLRDPLYPDLPAPMSIREFTKIKGAHSRLIEKMAPLFSHNVRGLLDRIDNPRYEGLKDILRPIYTRLFEKSVADGTYHGYDYIVRDQNGTIVGYLVGTIHQLPPTVVPTKELKILDCCQELILELQDQDFGRLNREIFGLESSLWRHAKEENIPIMGLETFNQQIEYDVNSGLIRHMLRQMSEEGRQRIRLMPETLRQHSIQIAPNLPEIYQQQLRLIDEGLPDPIVEKLSYIEILEAFRTGDESIDMSLSSPQANTIMLRQRNQNWAFGGENALIREGLIAKLRQGSAPICIAVGAAHLLGGESLVQILRQNGFIVEFASL